MTPENIKSNNIIIHFSKATDECNSVDANQNVCMYMRVRARQAEFEHWLREFLLLFTPFAR